jgi:hypothetical protein
MKFLTGLVASLVLVANASAQDDLASKMINQKTNGSWFVQPDKPKAKHIKAEVPGDFAFRVKANKGRNPWDVQASSPIDGPIKEGDVVMLMYYARAEVAAEGGSSLATRIQMNSPPWSTVLDFSSPISGEWKSYCAFRVANMSLDKSSVSVHLATAEQVIDLGPVFVFNFGKDYDKSKLSFCSG